MDEREGKSLFGSDCLRQLLPASYVQWGRGGYGGRGVQKHSHLHQRYVDRFGEETKAGSSRCFL